MAERIRSEFESTGIWSGNTRVSTTVSIGVAEVRGDDLVDRALERADAALYEAKSAGRNLVRNAGT